MMQPDASAQLVQSDLLEQSAIQSESAQEANEKSKDLVQSSARRQSENKSAIQPTKKRVVKKAAKKQKEDKQTQKQSEEKPQLLDKWPELAGAADWNQKEKEMKELTAKTQVGLARQQNL